jgi:hypothetical protein
MMGAQKDRATALHLAAKIKAKNIGGALGG